MVRKFLLPALLASTLAGCATNYYYRDAGHGGGYYYGDPVVEYDYYGGYGYGGYGYGWYGYGWPPFYSSWYGYGHYGFPYSHWGDPYPYYWPYYGDGYWNPRNPGRDDDELVEKRPADGKDFRHLRRGGTTAPDYVVMPRREGTLTERRGAEPRVLRLPERTSEPRAMRSPEPRPAPSQPPMRSSEPRSAPSLPPMRTPTVPRTRSPGMVRQSEE
jgi:hypothetical protein